MRAVVLALGLALVPSVALAAEGTIVVDGDAPSDGCPGAGTAEDPYGSLQCAFESPDLAQGTCIQLRDAASTYDGADTGALTLPSGVVVEPEPGHAPIFSGALVLSGVDGWTVRRLVFDGSSGESGGQAVQIRGSDNVTIEEVVVLDWLAEGIYINGGDNATLRSNRVDRAFGHGLWVQNATSTVIEGNNVSDMLCEQFTFDLCTDCGPDGCVGCGDCLDVGAPECLELTNFTSGGQIGLRVLDSTDTEIDGNWFHDFSGGGCGSDNTNSAAIFITAPGAAGGRIHHNLIERIIPDGAPIGLGHGILMFQEATGWTIDHNIVADVGTCGLCEGNWLFHGGAGTVWEHNTVVGSAWGIDVLRGADASFVNNIVTSPARVQPDGLDAPPNFDHNLYAGADVGAWGDDTAVDLASWQSACGCDGASAAGDPGFAGFTPAASGPAVDLGIDRMAPFHGASPDAGALEAPVLVSATVPAATPDTIVVVLENRAAPPLAPLSCGALTVVVDEAPRSVADCEAVTDEQLAVHLHAPIVQGEVVVVRPDAGALRDSARIGGRVDAVLGGEVTADNQAPPGTPGSTETGTGPDSGTGPASSTDTDGESSGQAGEGAPSCGCRTSAPLPTLLPLWLLLIARRRVLR